MFTIGSYFLSEIQVAEQREVRQREEEGNHRRSYRKVKHIFLLIMQVMDRISKEKYTVLVYMYKACIKNCV